MKKSSEKKLAYGRAYYYRNREAKLAKNKAWMQKNKEYRREYSWKKFLPRTYGITIEEYNELFQKQKGCCSICGLHQENFQKRLYTDHNHKSNKVRGLLCVNCNMLIGHAREDVNVLEKAINYLKKHDIQS